MQTKLEQKLKQLTKLWVTDTELSTLLAVSDNSRYAMIKRALANNVLIRLRRGLYVKGPALTDQTPHPYELAQKIYGPSYISLESAFSYHQLIPEAVQTITCVSTKRHKEFTTTLGIFTYYKLPTKNFLLDVTKVMSKDYQFFIANPWKAICDYIYCYDKHWDSLAPLSDDLRIEIEDLPQLTTKLHKDLLQYYNRSRITKFLKICCMPHNI